MTLKSIVNRLSNSFFLKNNKLEKIDTTANGSFIQSDMVERWSDRQWQNEFRYLKEAKMDYVIAGSSITKGGITETDYPSDIKDTVKKYGNVDIIDMLLRNAEKAGIKVFIGINYSEGWWEKGSRDSIWLYAQMDRGNLIADELYNKYKFKYPNAFYGWYFVYEVDNLNFRTKEHFTLLANAIDILLKHQEENGNRLPIMLSPFMNSKYGTAKAYSKNWAYMFQNCKLGKDDIFAPQDSVGGGGLNINEVDQWFKELRKAVDTKPGLLFWANTETFDYTNWTSATLNRFIKQVNMEAKYVDNIITFAYSHYYSPNNIDNRFHKNYLEYLTKGQLNENKPIPPSNITVKRLSDKEYLIDWDEGKSEVGIYGYELYRNGKMIYSTFLQRFYGGNKEGLKRSYRDNPRFICKLGKIVYDVRAIDFCGNVSEKQSIIIKR